MIFSAELTDSLIFRSIANYQYLKNSAPFDGNSYLDEDTINVRIRI